MTRLPWWSVVVVVVVGCDTFSDTPPAIDGAVDSGDVDAPVDAAIDGPDIDAAAPPVNPGFVLPTAITKANERTGGIWVEVGDADWTCLGTPSGDQPATTAIALSGQVTDFQTSDGVGAATLGAFAMGAPTTTSLGAATTSNVAATRGNYATTLQPLPASARRYGFSIEAAGYLRTYALDRYLTPGATQSLSLRIVSQSTANALPAFVGITRDASRALAIGSMVDCQGRAVSNAVATVSTSAGVAAQPVGMNTFYFSASSTSLPVRHTQAAVMNKDGLFVVLDVPPLTEAYLQVWGFRTTAELASGTMTLLAQVRMFSSADVVIDGVMTPRRAP